MGCLDIFLELVLLGLCVILYGLKFLFRCVVPPKRKNISGCTALVTGAGHGIGKHIAIGLANKGKQGLIHIHSTKYSFLRKF